MLKIEHIPPHIVKNKQWSYVHQLELILSSEKIWEAELLYINSPFPFYYIFFININKEFTNKWYGNKLVKEINLFLEKKWKIWILRNIIKNKDIKDIYKNNNRNYVNNTENYMIYNNKNIQNSKLKQALYNIKKIEENWKFYYW